jgi:molybdopterin synthase catalytic subunit
LIRIQYYGAARELAQTFEETALLEADAPTGRDLRRWVAAKHPSFATLIDRMTIAINDDLSPVDDRLRAGDLVSLLPPVAGGSPTPMSALSATPLSLDQALAYVSRPAAGGVCMFIGVVRDHADGKPVARLDYEAHVTLAAKEMERILQTLVDADPELRLCALHRVGELNVGDLAVIVAASAPHRAEAFAACRSAIDRIKETVPVWKKEWAPDGSAHWVNL